MSEFVNYNKRSVTLPPGCKDLIDVLGYNSKSDIGSISPDERVTRACGEGGTIPVSRIGEYVRKVCESRAELVQVMFSSPGQRLTVSLDRIRIPGAHTLAVTVVSQHEAEEGAIRAFFKRHGMASPDAQVQPGLPLQLTYRISPTDSDAPTVCRIITELFRDVCGLDGPAELRFCYNELT